MTSAVVGLHNGNKPIIPDHKLMLVACLSREEAHYLCALLNSSVGRFTAQSYAVAIQMDPHLLEHIRIPRFDPQNALHRALARLSERAHQAVAAGHDVGDIEAEIDRLAARLWGLTDEELREIQQNLQWLEGLSPDEGK